MSQTYGDNDISTYTVEFAGATFRFVYWHNLGYIVDSGTTGLVTDMPNRANLDVEISGSKKSDITINVGGYARRTLRHR